MNAGNKVVTRFPVDFITNSKLTHPVFLVGISNILIGDSLTREGSSGK